MRVISKYIAVSIGRCNARLLTSAQLKRSRRQIIASPAHSPPELHKSARLRARSDLPNYNSQLCGALGWIWNLYHAQRSMYFTERAFATRNIGYVKLSLRVSSLGDKTQVYCKSTSLRQAENSKFLHFQREFHLSGVKFNPL